MERTTFIKALATHFYPILRAEGFRGSGATLRRINDPIVHIFQFQGSSGGTSFYLNLGVHLLFLPTPGGGKLEAGSLKEYECVFRERFDSPSDTGLGWSYGRTEEEMNEVIEFIKDHWPIYGHRFFNQYSRYPQDFEALVKKVKPSKVHPMELVTLARIASHLGDGSRSKALAMEALRRCPESATILRAQLEQLAAN